MIKNKRFINTFAIFTIIIALVHFVLETLYTFKFGQTWLGLLPDYIAVTLMCAGGFVVLKYQSSWDIMWCLGVHILSSL